MRVTILDCYTDEPAGLGVPPYVGVLPRYIFGTEKHCSYLRIDDVRSPGSNPHKTDILTFNQTKNAANAKAILHNSDAIIVIAGIQTPGKYLTAVPGSCKEAARLLAPFKAKKLLAGPSAGLGSSQFGGRFARNEASLFDGIYEPNINYQKLPAGAGLLAAVKPPFMIELETGRGCPRTQHCSFCAEPIKHKLEWRAPESIISEVKSLMKQGARHFRLGKQSDIYSYSHLKQLLEGIHQLKPKTLHIDNVDPAIAATPKGEAITQLIVKHCSSGNVAPLGVESFDPAVIQANSINSSPEQAMKAIHLINKHGAKRGSNGMPQFLPGINLLLGLKGESKATLELNLKYLTKLLKSGLLLRRINIRQVEIIPGTPLSQEGSLKFLKKNKKHYFSFRKAVREQIDHEMLKLVAPVGTILKDVYMEIHDGKHSFGRQLGTYPLIVGVNEKLELSRYYDVKVTGHMLRSIVAQPIQTRNPGP